MIDSETQQLPSIGESILGLYQIRVGDPLLAEATGSRCYTDKDRLRGLVDKGDI